MDGFVRELLDGENGFAIKVAASAVIAAVILFIVSSAFGGSNSGSRGGAKKSSSGGKSKKKKSSKKKADAPAVSSSETKKSKKSKKKKKSKAAAKEGVTPAAAAPVAQAETEAAEDAKKKKKKKKKKPKTEAQAAAGANNGDNDGWEEATGFKSKRKYQKAKEKKSTQNSAPRKNGNGESKANVVVDDGFRPVGFKPSKHVASKTTTAAAPAAPFTDNQQPAEEKTEFSIPGSKIGVIIGPQGTTMRAIEEKSGAEKIDISGGAGGNAKVTITGDKDAALVAKRAILELCEKGYAKLISGDDFTETFIKVHPQYFATIIGPGGSCIRAIQDKLNVRLNIPKNTGKSSNASRIPGAQKRATSASAVKVTIAGPKDGVDTAKATIEHLIRYHCSEITHPDVTHAELAISQDYFSILIGRKGSTLKHIQGNFRVQVHIPRDESVNDKVVIVGDARSVEGASKYVRKLISDYLEEQQAYENPPAEEESKSKSKLQGYREDEVAEHESWMDEFIHPNSRGKANQWR